MTTKDLGIASRRTGRRTVTKLGAAAAAGAGAAQYVKPGFRALGIPMASGAALVGSPGDPGSACGKFTGGGQFGEPVTGGSTTGAPISAAQSIQIIGPTPTTLSTAGTTYTTLTGTVYCCLDADACGIDRTGNNIEFNVHSGALAGAKFHMLAQVQAPYPGLVTGTTYITVFGQQLVSGKPLCDGNPTNSPGSCFNRISGFAVGEWSPPDPKASPVAAWAVFSFVDNSEPNSGADLSSIAIYIGGPTQTTCAIPGKGPLAEIQPGKLLSDAVASVTDLAAGGTGQSHGNWQAHGGCPAPTTPTPTATP